MCTALVLPSVLTISTVLDELLLYLVYVYSHCVSSEASLSPVLQLVPRISKAPSFFPRATKAPTCESLVVKPPLTGVNENQMAVIHLQ